MSTTPEQPNGATTLDTKRARMIALREQLVAFAHEGRVVHIATRFKTGEPGCAVGRIGAVTRDNATILLNRTAEVVVPLTAIEVITPVPPQPPEEHR